jgi:DNA end-binding protein Ku
MRAIWSGVLSFGLINIPVGLYSATAGEKISFNFLHKTDMSPIRFAKVCRKDGKELNQSDLVKGYEYEEGDYVILTSDDFKKVDLKRTETIDVQAFVSESEIDTIYFEKPYYLEPAKGSVKAYSLLRESLNKSKKVGVAKFVIHNREHLGIIKPHGKLIVLEQMRFEEEVHAPEKLNIPEHPSLQAKELSIATSFIDQMTENFNPKDYKDTYIKKLLDMIKMKKKGHTIKIEKKVETLTPSKSTDLMLLLKESLEKAKATHTIVHA